MIFASIIVACVCVGSIFILFQFTQGPKGDAAGQFTSFYDDFASYNSTNWIRLDHFAYGSPFNCIWRSSQVDSFASSSINGMTLTLANDTDHSDTPDLPYASGELQSTAHYGYGLYEIRMKPVIHSGVVSSFYIVTGPWDCYITTGPGVEERPKDEIDIEFIVDPNDGNPNPTMQCNYFTNGTGNHEYKVDLTFDATQDYHTYAFKWEANKITWYIDGTAVHSATDNIPSHAARIDMNLWPTINYDQWAGHYDGTVPLVAYYDWVRYTP
jgi:beta-glucanase (GH16 family)